MLAFQALPVQTPIKPKRHFARNLAVAVVVAVMVTAILTSSILSGAPTNSGNQNINSNYTPAIVLTPMSGAYFTGFGVPEDALNPVLQGNFTSTGNSTNNNVVVTVWSQKEFINYLSGHDSSPCYNKDMFTMATGNINVTLSSGNYFIMFGSASLDSKIVSIQIDLTYSV